MVDVQVQNLSPLSDSLEVEAKAVNLFSFCQGKAEICLPINLFAGNAGDYSGNVCRAGQFGKPLV